MAFDVGNVANTTAMGASAGSAGGPWGALIGGVVGLGGGIIGELVASGRQEEADRIMAKAYAAYGSIDLPTLEQVAAQELGETEYRKIKEDPRLKDAQLQALSQLQQVTKDGGLGINDRAMLNRSLGEANRVAQANQQGILENAAARGRLDSGAMLAAQLQNAQGTANRAQQAGLDVAGQAQQRALQAMMNAGQLGGQIRGQEWQQQSDAARAQDAIARYNADARTNAAMNSNAVKQQDYLNRLDQGKRNMARAEWESGRISGKGEKEGQMWRDGAQTAGTVIQQVGQYANNSQANQDPRYQEWLRGGGK